LQGGIARDGVDRLVKFALDPGLEVGLDLMDLGQR